MFLGELGLNGDLRPVRGVLPAAILARSMGYTTLFVPEENAREAAVVDRVQVFGVRHLTEVIGHLEGRAPLLPTIVDTRAEFYAAQETFPYDFSEVKGQPLVKRAFEVAAAGGHNLLLVGSPGCGKSMMAKRLPSILPPLSLAESLETTQIHSVAGKLGRGDTLISTRPFRSPHHTISDVASSVAVHIFSPARSVWRTTACSFSTNFRNTPKTRSKPSASRSKTAKSAYRVPVTTSRSPALSCSLPP